MRRLAILIADDNPMVRNVIAQMLERENYAVMEADSARAAVVISRRFPGVIDLLIADHALRAMTGRQVAEQISQARPGLKVLHISGYPLHKIKEECGIIPGADFLAKPF